jgi:hypothetical protein
VTTAEDFVLTLVRTMLSIPFMNNDPKWVTRGRDQAASRAQPSRVMRCISRRCPR